MQIGGGRRERAGAGADPGRDGAHAAVQVHAALRHARRAARQPAARARAAPAARRARAARPAHPARPARAARQAGPRQLTTDRYRYGLCTSTYHQVIQSH